MLCVTRTSATRPVLTRMRKNKQSTAPEMVRSCEIRVIGFWSRLQTRLSFCPRRELLFGGRRGHRFAADQKREAKCSCGTVRRPNEKWMEFFRNILRNYSV